MKLNIDLTILNEHKKIDRKDEYMKLKNKIICALHNDKWEDLPGKLTSTDKDFMNECLKSECSNVGLNLELEELVNSKENAIDKSAKLK